MKLVRLRDVEESLTNPSASFVMLEPKAIKVLPVAPVSVPSFDAMADVELPDDFAHVPPPDAVPQLDALLVRVKVSVKRFVVTAYIALRHDTALD